jgi:spermidine/putrescine-binding protein
MNEILDRYLKYNQHAGSYTWKYNGEVLDMDKTLEENEIKDDDTDFDRLKMRDDSYLQSIMLYYNDDLTEA